MKEYAIAQFGNCPMDLCGEQYDWYVYPKKDWSKEAFLEEVKDLRPFYKKVYMLIGEDE